MADQDFSNSDYFLEHLEQTLAAAAGDGQHRAVRLVWQIEKARESFKEYYHRLHYQFIRDSSELNRLDKPQWLFEYLNTHFEVWVDQETKKKADLASLVLMVSSCLLQKFLQQKQAIELEVKESEEQNGQDVVAEVEQEIWSQIRDFVAAHQGKSGSGSGTDAGVVTGVTFKFFEDFSFYEVFASQQLQVAALSKIEAEFSEDQGALPIASSVGETVGQVIQLLSVTIASSTELRGNPKFKEEVSGSLKEIVRNMVKDKVRGLFTAQASATGSAAEGGNQETLTMTQASELIAIISALASWKGQDENDNEVDELLASVRSILSWKVCSKAVGAVIKNPDDASTILEAANASLIAANKQISAIGREKVMADFELKKVQAEWMIMAKQDIASGLEEDERLAAALTWLSMQLSKE